MSQSPGMDLVGLIAVVCMLAGCATNRDNSTDNEAEKKACLCFNTELKSSRVTRVKTEEKVMPSPKPEAPTAAVARRKAKPPVK